jgi:integrase
MASLTNEPNGHRTIQFALEDGRRRSIRLGKINKKAAQTIKIKIEHLINHRKYGHPLDETTARWLKTLGETMSERLVAAGLLEKKECANLGQFLDEYTSGRTDVKGSTQLVYGHTRRNLIAYFGREKALRDITRGDADAWRRYLIDEGLSKNTVRRRCGIAKQFFRAAVRLELIDRNPFEDLKVAVGSNPDRVHFIDRATATRVLEACPDDEWRLLFALSRYGGLRCPSEHLSMRWKDVDWDNDRITIRSPKTEHLDSGGIRQIPIFPELRPYLEAVREQAGPDGEYVITRYRQLNVNLRTQLMKILKRAGIEPWPKLFQNLRASRETELTHEFPIHVVCAWIGNTPAIALKHYLQVTDEHFKQGAAADNPVQNPVQRAAKPCSALLPNASYSDNA